MIRVALKGLWGRKLRTFLTALAIVLGVSMISGTYILTDTITASFTKVVDGSYENADAVVSGKVAFKNTNSNTEETPAFPDAVLADVKRLPDVAAAAGTINDQVKLIGRDGKVISTKGGESIGTSVDPKNDAQFTPLKLVSGQWPVGNGQIAIDQRTSDKQDYSIGDTIGVAADQGVRQFEIAGIAKFSSSDSIGASTIAIFDVPTAQDLFNKDGKFDQVQVAAKQGVTPETLVGEIRPVLPETAQVKTAEAQTQETVDDINEGVGIFQKVLLAFGFIALFVGAFVIANTLSITIAQRMREFATLRTIGGSRRQVLRSVMLEALVVGVMASVIGLFFGLAIAKGLNALFSALGVEFPSGGTVFATRTIVVSLLVGVVVTLLASLRPAIKATRVPPIAAVREGASLPASSLSRWGPVVSIVTLALGILLLVYGIFGGGLTTAARLSALGFGTLILFVGVALNAKRAVRPLAAVLGWPGTRIGGTAGTLARENAMRNPSRTASTASALMIGLALITFVAILGAGLRTSFGDAVDKLFVADYALTAENGFDPFTTEADAAVAGTPGVTAVSGIRHGSPAERGGDDPDRLAAGRREHPVPAGQGRRIRREGLRQGSRPEDRLADRGQDADGPGAPPAPEGHLRSTQGRLAVRLCDDVRRDLRRELHEAAQPDDADQHEGRRQRSEHGRPSAVAPLLPRREGRHCEPVQEEPGGRHQPHAEPPLRAPRPVRDHQPLRRREHAGPVRLRTDA
jgi:putative ABC transport system permease protein